MHDVYNVHIYTGYKENSLRVIYLCNRWIQTHISTFKNIYDMAFLISKIIIFEKIRKTTF